MQAVQTLMRLAAPLTDARTSCKLMFQRRFVKLWAWLTRLPNCGPRPQITHFRHDERFTPSTVLPSLVYHAGCRGGIIGSQANVLKAMDQGHIQGDSIVDRYFYRELTLEELTAFEAHLVDCEVCRDRVLLAGMFHVRNGLARHVWPDEGARPTTSTSEDRNVRPHGNSSEKSTFRGHTRTLADLADSQPRRTAFGIDPDQLLRSFKTIA